VINGGDLESASTQERNFFSFPSSHTIILPALVRIKTLRLTPPPATSLKSISAEPPGSTAGSRCPPTT